MARKDRAVCERIEDIKTTKTTIDEIDSKNYDLQTGVDLTRNRTVRLTVLNLGL